MALSFEGCSTPYREAVEGRLTERGFDTRTSEVTLIQCDTEARWKLLRDTADLPDVVVVAVLPVLDLHEYARALADGARGVVFLNSSSAITADVIETALKGEVLLPYQAAHDMALLARKVRPPTDLTDADITLLRAVAAGTSVVRLAKDSYFSERTVRRHMQGLYLKMGVQNRAEAIAAGTRMGLID